MNKDKPKTVEPTKVVEPSKVVDPPKTVKPSIFKKHRPKKVASGQSLSDLR